MFYLGGGRDAVLPLSSVYNILSGSICGIGCGQHPVEKLHSDMEHLTPALLANLS